MCREHSAHSESCDDENEWCVKIPPALRIFASVGVSSNCCIARGKSETDLKIDQSIAPSQASAKGLQVEIGGLGIATGAVSAQSEGGKDFATYTVLYMADNIVQTTTFKICWWTCGGYPGKHVELKIAETFPPASDQDVALSKELNTYTCLPPSSSCCDCCCLTFVIKSCHTCDELGASDRRHRQFQFTFKVVDGADKSQECTVTAIEP